MENTNDTPFGIYILRVLTLFGICGMVAGIADLPGVADVQRADTMHDILMFAGKVVELILVIVATVAIFSKKRWAWVFLMGQTASQVIIPIITAALIILPTLSVPDFVLFLFIGAVIELLVFMYLSFPHVAAHFRVFEVTREVKVEVILAILILSGIYAITFIMGLL